MGVYKGMEIKYESLEKAIAGGILRAMKDAQKEGKIRFLGVSIDGDLAAQLIETNDFSVM